MAFPSVFTNCGFSLTTAGTSVGFGYTIAPSAGQLVVAMLRWAAAPGAVTFTGYTQFATDSSDASDDTTSLYYRWTDGGEGSADPVSWVNSVKAAAAGFVIDDAMNPASQVPQTSTVAIGTGANANSTTVTPTGGAKDYLFIVVLGWDGEGITGTSPTGYSARIASNSGTGGAAATNCGTFAAWDQINAASEDPGAWTSSAPNAGWTAWTIAVHPEAAAGAVTRDPWGPTLQAVNRSSVF